MIAKRINHKDNCQHAQTPHARRVCRRALIATTIANQPKEATVRYSMNVATVDGRPMYQVIDGENGSVHYEARFPVNGMVGTLNAPPVGPEVIIREDYEAACLEAAMYADDDDSRQARRAFAYLTKARDAYRTAGLLPRR